MGPFLIMLNIFYYLDCDCNYFGQIMNQVLMSCTLSCPSRLLRIYLFIYMCLFI